MSDRAVSSPVGVILIIGMTVASVAALFAVGGAVISDTRADAERTQMENAMSSFSSKASLVGLGESGDQRFSLGRASEGDIFIDERSGNVSIYVEDSENNRTYIGNASMGAVVYRNEGTEIAYQGGGVWHRSGGFTRMVSPPEYHYRSETLTFPVMNVIGQGASSGDVRGTVTSRGDSQALYPNRTKNETFVNPLSEGTVYVKIQSRYCQGWETFLQERSQGSPEQTCEKGPSDTVIFDLTVDANPVFGSAVTAGKTYEPGNADVTNYREGTFLPSATQKIDDKINSCIETGNVCDSFSASETLDPGTYYTENMDDFNDLTLNASGDDIDIVLNDTDETGLEEPGEIIVNGDGNATVYLKTDNGFEVTGGGNSGINAGGDPTQFSMFIYSGADITFNGGTEFSGALYAPRSKLKTAGGNIDVTGAVIVEEFDMQASSATFDFNPAMENVNPEIDANTIKYLHVSENPVRVEFE